MTFTELMGLCNGNYIEAAGTTAKNQCVDLANAYIKYCLGLPMIEYTNAKDFPSKVSLDNYTFEKNTPSGVPVEGDLVIWDGTYGHIAIALDGCTTSKIISFDQNYPTGSPCRVVEHNYTNVLGWLHPKNLQPDPQIIIEQLRSDRDRNWNYFVSLCNALGVGANVDVAVAEIKKLVTVEDTLVEKDKQLQESQTKIADLENKLADLASKAIELTTENGVLAEKVKDGENKITQQQSEIGVMKAELKDLKDSINDVTSGWQLIQKGIKRLFGIG